MSPVLIFGIIGYFYLPYETLVLFLLLTVPLFLLVSKHKTWWAGGGGDHRYLTSMIPYLVIPLGLAIKNLIFLLPLIIFLALVSLMMVISKMIALTVSVNELKKLDPKVFKRIKKNKLGLLGIMNFKYIKKLVPLVFEGLFVRKIRLENKFYKKDI